MRLGMWILRLAIVAVPALSVVLLAQQASVTPALYMSAADVAKGLSTAVAADAAGAAVTVAPNIVVRRRIGVSYARAERRWSCDVDGIGVERVELQLTLAAGPESAFRR